MAESKKRNRTPAIRRDPLIDALIRKLPPENGQFAVEARLAWLRMAVQAFDVAYGPAAAIAESRDGRDPHIVDFMRQKMAGIENPKPPADDSNVTPLRRPTEDEIAALDEPRYYIDKDGFARGPGGARVKVSDVPGDAIIEDERGTGGELDTIVWADGSWPAHALPSLNIQAA